MDNTEDQVLMDNMTDINFKCYICALCDLKFANQTDLDLHNQLHAGTSGFSCPLCKAILPNLHQLQLHDLKHSLAEAQEDVENLSDFDIFGQPSMSSICIICGEGFSSEEELIDHCSSHADVTNNLEETTSDFEKENDFVEPILINEGDVKVILAKKTFHRPTRPLSRRPPDPYYEANQPYLTEEQEYQLQKVLTLNTSQVKRKNMDYSIIEEEFCDDIAENDEVSAPKTKRRKPKVGGAVSPKNKCDQCKKIFSNSFSLKRHKSIIHLNKRPYACTFCRKTFIQMCMLTKHTLLHHAPSTETFACEYCSEEFTEPDLLHQHIKVIHEMKYSCEACFKFFVEKEDHIRHMREHVTTFGFDCCRCRRRYKNDWELKRHRCIQEGPRPFLCKVCGKRFNRKYHLIRHFRTHQIESHSGYGVKIEYGSDGPVEKPIREFVRNKMIHTSKNLISHYKTGTRTMLGRKMNWQCYICDEKWPNLRRYKQHFMMTHKKVKFNSCHICSKQFSTAYKVRRHLSCHDIPGKTDDSKVSKKESKFSGNESRVTKSELKVQQNTSEEFINDNNNSTADVENSDDNQLVRRRKYECYICDMKCPNLRRYKLHFQAMHKKVKFNSCHICSKQFPNSFKVKRHLPSHRTPLITANNSDNLQEQSNTREASKEIILYDNTSIAEYENANTYGRGVKKTFLCYICKKNCLSYKRYKQHFFTEHKDVKLNSCHLCRKQFATSSKVKRHLQSHTQERHFRCHACDRRFAQLSHLKRHRILMHTVQSERRSKCPHCPKSFADKPSFEKHILMHQLAETSNFKCTVCKEKFPDEKLLDEHILAFHDFFKKFQCGTCKRRFSHRSYLNRHMMTHTGTRKWKCFKCNKRFGTKSDLTRHSITHTNLKPFPCFFCEKCFTRKSNRQKHISLSHDIKNVKLFDDEENDVKPFQDITDKQKMILMTFN